MRLLAKYKYIVAALGLGLVACAPAAKEDTRAAAQDIDARFDPSTPASLQADPWSCSVHTTFWMLEATGSGHPYSDVVNRMTATGRATSAYGLSDASGSGLVVTLEELADGTPEVGNAAYASFDDVAARAGRMAVGIGGRGWNHWSGVRGYDADRDALLLANPAPGWKGVSGEMTRGQFAALGGFAMVWMDFGQIPDAPPFAPSPEPTGGPFRALRVKSPIQAGEYVTQCNDAADAERVWQTDGSGPEEDMRWAPAQYPQRPWQTCGKTSAEGVYPLVFRNMNPGEIGSWITQCAEDSGVAHVYETEGEVDGHPAAAFRYDEASDDCP
ncbi:MAG TPA: hypothetical protein VIF62_18030 [Labilithrix sp.]|jgi:hypothetical protein